MIKKGDILNNFNNYSLAISFYQEALELDPSLFMDINDKYTELVINILSDISNANNLNDLKLVKEYLGMIIKLKPQYSDFFKKFIIQIDERFKKYDSDITKLNLKKYVQEKRSKKIGQLSKEIKLGMTIHDIELILGKPNSVDLENEYELWVYHKSNREFRTYFFKNYILVKID